MRVVAIRIQPGATAGTYGVTLIDSPFGAATETFSADLPESDVASGAPWTPAAMRKEILENAGVSGNFEAIGRRLCAWLDVGGLLARWRAMVTADPEGSLTLLDIRVPALGDAPWELLCDSRPVAQRPFLDPQHRIARFHAIDADRRSIASSWPLRVLIVLGVRMGDGPAEDTIAVRQEVEAIERELLPVGRSVDVELLEVPTQPKLKEVVSDFQPHIFHFVGHGREDSRSTGHGVLHFELPSHPASGADRSWPWDAAGILAMMQSVKWHPRLVVLNACRSAEGSVHSLAVARAFTQAAVPAVISMQADVRGEAAGLFAARVYRGLARREQLVEAVAAARLDISNREEEQGRGLQTREWALPVLSLGVAPDTVFPANQEHDAAVRSAIRLCPVFLRCKPFADRRAQRRQILRNFFPILPGEPRRHGIIVTGPRRVGKSALAEWCVESCALRGYEVRHIEVSDKTERTFLSLIRTIIRGTPALSATSILHRPLPPEYFHEFFWELNQILTSGKPRNELPQWDGTPQTDLNLTFADKGAKEDIFASFRYALSQATTPHRPDAPARDLVLLFDRFTADDGTRYYDPRSFARDFVPYLLAPIVAGELPHVRVILVVDDEKDFSEFGLADLKGAASLVVLNRLPKEEWRRIAREFLWYRSDPQLEEVIAGRERGLSGDWLPEEFEILKYVGTQWRSPIFTDQDLGWME